MWFCMVSARTSFRAALITGASSGIGEAFARALPASTSLLLTGRDEQALQRLSEDLRSGRPVETLVADLAADRDLDGLSATAERFGLDLLICNAGLGPFGNFLDANEAALRQT